MNKFEFQLGVCQSVIKVVTSSIESGTSPELINYKNLYDEFSRLRDLMPDSLAMYRDRLSNVIIPNIKLKDIEQINQLGQKFVYPRNGINPYVLGQLIATLHYIKGTLESPGDSAFWQTIHPSIVESSKKLFSDLYYAEAVEAAFLEISVRVKRIVKEKICEDLDGTAAMQRAFSVNNPIISVADITTRTGKDIQQGVMEMFCGSIRFIRNPQAHEKIVIDEKDAISKLHLASMLMYQIDKAGTFDRSLVR